ncbi:MAG TPA: hypothetical protein VGC79_22565 [Polyangiaceae bacterium]
MPLIDLVSKYMNSASVQKAYARDPKKVLADYGVKGPLLKVLQSDGLSAAIAAELKTLGGRGVGGIHPLGWGIAAMTVSNYSPDSAEAGVEFDLTIDGTEFTADTQAALLPGDQSLANLITASKTVVISARKLVGTFKVKADKYVVGVYRLLPSKEHAGAWLAGKKLKVVAAKPARKKKPKTKGSKR